MAPSRRRGFLAVAIWAFVIALVFFASWLVAQAPQRGTGYVASHASWEKQDGRRLVTFPIDHSAHPWGNDGGPAADDALFASPDFALYLKRYAGGSATIPRDEQGVSSRGIGAWGEAMGQNVEGLKRWYSQQSPQHQAKWSGEPTVEEAWDAAFSQVRNGSFYRTSTPTPTPTPRPTATPTPSPTPVATPTPPCPTCPELPTCSPLPATYQSRLDAFLLRLATWPVKAGERRFVRWQETVEARQLRDGLRSTGQLGYCLEVP